MHRDLEEAERDFGSAYITVHAERRRKWYTVEDTTEGDDNQFKLRGSYTEKINRNVLPYSA